MIDFSILVLAIIIASQLAKRSISTRVYLSLLTGHILVLLIGTVVIFTNSYIAGHAISFARYLNALDIGNPFAWRSNTMTFKEQMDAFYYLNFTTLFTMCLSSIAYEHQSISKYRKKGLGINMYVLIMIFLFFLTIYYVTNLASGIGITRQFMRLIYNSSFFFFSWELLLLMTAAEYGKFLRTVFTINNIKD